MNCDECDRLNRMLLEAIVFADRAQAALRCFLITHQRFSGVSDFDEYLALRSEERNSMERRHDAVLTLVHHEKDEHGERQPISATPSGASVRL